jgi:hypothetical protein
MERGLCPVCTFSLNPPRLFKTKARAELRSDRLTAKRTLNVHTSYVYGVDRRPKKNDTAKRTRNNTNSTCAIHADVPAIPPKPNTPAIIAIIRNKIENLSIRLACLEEKCWSRLNS